MQVFLNDTMETANLLVIVQLLLHQAASKTKLELLEKAIKTVLMVVLAKAAAHQQMGTRMVVAADILEVVVALLVIVLLVQVQEARHLSQALKDAKQLKNHRQKII